jgi:outer membrane lipoprotein-sorting protein
MNPNKHELPADILEQATAELRSSREASAPSAELLAATVRLLESELHALKPTQHEVVPHQSSPRAGQSSTRRSQMIKLVRWSSVTAAAVLVAVLLASLLGSRGAAFAQVIEKIKQAQSVTVRCTQRAGTQEANVSRCFLRGDQMRLDLYLQANNPTASPDTIVVADFKKLEMLYLDRIDKTYRRDQGVNKNAMRQFGSPLKWLAELTNENVELIGEEDLGGQKVQAYRLKKIDYPLGVGKIDENKTNRVWVDPKTGLPVKIVVNYFDTLNNRNTEDVYDNFRWNEPIAEELFSFAVPDGFKAADGNGGAAVVPPFAQVLENVKKATSAMFTVIRNDHSRADRNVMTQIVTKWHWIDGFERIETADKKNLGIIDYKQKLSLKLDFEKKTAHLREVSDAQAVLNPLDDLCKVAAADAELIETTELDGKKVRVYQLKQVHLPRFGLAIDKKTARKLDARVWVDNETNLPVRISLALVSPGDKNNPSAVLEKFTWNEPLDPKLFNLDIPEGFKLIESKPKGAGPAR